MPAARSFFSESLNLCTLSSVDRFAFRLYFAVDVVAKDPDGAMMLDLVFPVFSMPVSFLVVFPFLFLLSRLIYMLGCKLSYYRAIISSLFPSKKRISVGVIPASAIPVVSYS